MTKKKRGVLLLNLGSPDSTDVADVKRYLDEFLMDPYVIDYPYLLRALVVRGIILRSRPAKSAEAYKEVWTDRGSPLIFHSQDLADKVSKKLDIPLALGMRYANPSVQSACEALLNESPDLDEIVAMPLYPQYAMSSTKTCVEAIECSLKKLKFKGDLTIIDPIYNDPNYIQILADSIQAGLPETWDHLLFSFHGLPERHLKKTDPTGQHCLRVKDCCSTPCKTAHAVCYSHQCYETMHLVAKALGLSNDQYSISFQSRLGRDKWIEPYTDVKFETLPKEGVKNLAVVCPAFVADCLETLEEIAMEGQEDFLAAGGTSFTYIPCLNSTDPWVEFVRNKVR